MAESPSELQFEIETLERKHAENPEGRFFVPLANAYRKLGDVETAEALLRHGIDRHPDYLSAHIVLGRCLADRGETREAEEEFRFVLSQDPQNLIALRTLGELAAADGRVAEAADWYNELLAVDPMNEDARQALDTLSGAGASAEVESDFRAGSGWWQAEQDPDAPAEPAEIDLSSSEVEPEADVSTYGDISLEDDRGESPAASYASAQDDAPPPAEGETRAADEFWSAPADDLADDDAAASDDSVGYAGAGSSEVVTETIAELYARQGLHERATGVYRELIRRRGGDPALERRLAEIERLAAEERMTDAAEEELPTLAFEDDEARPTPALDAEEDAFAASFSDGFATVYDDEPSSDLEEELPTTGAEPSWESSAPTEASGPAPGAVTIAQALSALASWRPGRVGAPPVGEDSPLSYPEEQPSPETTGESLPDTMAEGEREQGEVAGTATYASTDPQGVEVEGPTGAIDPWDLESGMDRDTSVRAAELPYLEEVGEAPSAAGTGSADDEPFPWELPDEVEPEPAEDSSLPAGDAEVRGLYAEESVDPLGEPASAITDETPPATAERDAEPEATASADGSEDEDLESFQAWLRSLKR